MASTLAVAPIHISLSKDDNYVVLTTNLISYSPSVARIIVSDGSNPSSSQTFTISWGANELVFTFVASPDNSGLQLPLKNSGEIGEDYRARLAEVFQQNERISAAFQIINSSANQVIRFQYRITEPLDLSVESTATGMAALVESTGEYPSTEENLRAKLQLFDATSTDGLPLANLAAVYSSRNPYEAIFNLRNLAPVKPYLPVSSSLAPTVEGVNNYTVEVAITAFRELYLRYADKYGTPPFAESLYKSDSFFVLYGGSPGNSRRLFGSTLGLWLCHSYYGSDEMSYEKPVAPDQPDYIFLFSGSSTFDIGFQVKLIYSDGSNESFVVPSSSPLAMAANTLYCLPSGPEQVVISSAPSYATKTPVAYEFQITDSSYIAVIKRVKYQLISGCLPWQLILAYSNGLGAIETVALHGKTTYGYDAIRELFERVKTRGYQVSDGTTVAYDEQGIQIYEASTAPLPRNYIRHLRQLLLADTWLIDQRGLRFQRIQIITTSMREDKDDQDLYSLSISFRLSATDESYHQL